jgi:glyoxalase superfamily protein
VAPGRVQVTFDCADPVAVATFWAAVLGYPPPELGTNEDGEHWSRIADPTGNRPRLFFQRVPEPKVVKNRVHLDVAVPHGGPGDRRQQIDAEVERVVGLGGRQLRSVTDEAGYFVVMQDPEGNEFCID